MTPFPLYDDDAKQDSPLNKIIRGTLWLALTLSSAPTTAGNELPNHGDNGFFGTNWYINLGGSTYSVSLTLV